jgi:hypothetical protein
LSEACFAGDGLLDFAFAKALLEGGMSMGYCRLGFALIATFGLLVVDNAQPSGAAGAAASAVRADASLRGGVDRIERRALHRHRTQSFYCYPKNYWWFYRPYTTAFDGHPRCMPYFHQLPGGGRGARAKSYAK